MLLEFRGRRHFGVRPFSMWEWRADSVGDALSSLRAAWQLGREQFPRGGMLGYFSYDFARHLEPRAFGNSPADDLPIPHGRWTFYEELQSAPAEVRSNSTVLQELSEATACDNDTDYEIAVARVLEYISAGDIYQANLTRRFHAPLRYTPRELFERLQQTPMPHAALLDYDDFALVSHSPERFFSLQEGVVTAQPIKGTRARGDNAEDDERLRRELETSAKDRAENVMIVDLLRNDLGRVCEFGSVRVPELFAIRPFPTVWHGVSTVVGKLRSTCDVFDVLRAAFPCGSITGAPKIRAMQIIDDLETARRGVAMGAIGWIDFAGNADLNVAIRTATCLGNDVWFHAGGGIVAESEPQKERLEIEAKTRALRLALA
ncbi:MAG TPA: aminodeoxychorismate synthase component I [Abditibacteriaceae bacterium]|jgi:para-aminobenzoate synthetase component 1